MTSSHHRPVVYAGRSCSKAGVDRLAALGWGQCYSEGPHKQRPPLRWFFDNGAWDAFRRGKPFPAKVFRARIQRCVERGHTPDFIVLPDVVGDPIATLDLSCSFVGELPAAWPRYLALQNGVSANEVEAFVKANAINGLFLGGDDRFKNTEAIFWRGIAWELGVAFHYARAGTPRKFEHAMLVRADSLDSSRLSRSWRDFFACRKLWLDGAGHPRFWVDEASREAVSA